MSNAKGLRAVAVFEAAKGLLVLLVALGFLGLFRDGNAEATAHSLLLHLHISPDRRLSGVLLHAVNRTTDAELWGIAAGALAYAAVRAVESWGLWRGRAWAQWFSLLSGAMYLPWEFLEWALHRTWLHTGLVVGNLAIVLYMLFLRLRART